MQNRRGWLCLFVRCDRSWIQQFPAYASTFHILLIQLILNAKSKVRINVLLSAPALNCNYLLNMFLCHHKSLQAQIDATDMATFNDMLVINSFLTFCVRICVLTLFFSLNPSEARVIRTNEEEQTQTTQHMELSIDLFINAMKYINYFSQFKGN